jgi:hypothetical protein
MLRHLNPEGAPSRPYSPECVEGVFYELRAEGVLGRLLAV